MSNNNILLPLEFLSSKRQIAVIGSSGYIGSRILQYLQRETNSKVNGFDRIFSGQASYEISTKHLRKYNVIIYLGGLTSRVICQQQANDVDKENIQDIYQLAKRMLPSQLLIFASTAAIAEGFGEKSFHEDSSVHSDRFDLYTSSMFHRENTLRNLSLTWKYAPQMIGLRFGTVIGLSNSQRIDLVHMTLVCQAFLNNRIRITHPDSYRAFLGMNDLLRAISTIIEYANKAKQFDLFHLQSFSASISNVANTIAMRTRAFVDVIDLPNQNTTLGFSLNTTKFQTTFNFIFQDNQDEIITNMMHDVPRMCLGRQSRIDNQSIPCIICGSTEMHRILDLHEFPFRLVRCPKCHHIQLSYIANRSLLCQNVQNNFEWLAKKIIDETSVTNGTVLEIGCNNESQFIKHDWKTIRIESDKNLARFSNAFDVILAQNVLAQVPNPVDFLRRCFHLMNDKTRLYIQMSACDIFDSISHEYISFFTAHSFKKIADLIGLKIINFEKHSCLVTFQRMISKSNSSFETVYDKEELSPISLAIERERRLGLDKPWFYLKFQAQIENIRQWMTHQLANLQEQGHTIVAPLKRNIFCPISTLQQHDPNKPLTIVISVWTFWEEIREKLRQTTIDKGMNNVFIMLPFPQQKLIKLESNITLLSQNIYKPLPWPGVFQFVRRPVLLISHFFNEEFLLPFWIRHHASMFDIAILINYNSTDRSVEIIRQQAPHTWKIVSSRNKEFDPRLVDDEVMDYEKTYPSAWKIALNTPEFLVHSDLRQALVNLELEQTNTTIRTYRFRSILMSGNDSLPFQPFTSLLKQRSQYLCSESDHADTVYSRFIHREPYARYMTGRHSLEDTHWEWLSEGFIAKFQYTPWPQIMNRKLQIRARMPDRHFQTRWLHHHNLNSEQLLSIIKTIAQKQQCNLRNYTTLNDEFKMIHRVWNDVINH